MKFLIVSGAHDVVVVTDEQRASQIKQGQNFDRVLNLDEKEPIRNQVQRDNVVPLHSRATSLDLNNQLEALEEKLVREAMATTNNNQVRAAKLLGITRGALQYKLKRLAAKTQVAA